MKAEATTLAERIRQETVRRPYRTLGVAMVAGATLLTHIESVLDGTILPREQLEAAAATYLIYYQNHIRTEESAILGRASQHLTADDWKAVHAAVPDSPDPLFGADPQDRFRELLRQIAQEAAAKD